MHSGSIDLLVTESYIKLKTTISIETVFGFPSCHAIASVCFIVLLGKSSPVTGLEWPRGFQEVKVPRFHDNGTGWW